MFYTIRQFYVLYNSSILCFIQFVNFMFYTICQFYVLYNSSILGFIQFVHFRFYTIRQFYVLYNSSILCFIQFVNFMFYTIRLFCLFKFLSIRRFRCRVIESLSFLATIKYAEVSYFRSFNGGQSVLDAPYI